VGRIGIVNWRAHITVDPEVCHGQACFAGTRVTVTVVLDNLAAGRTEAEVLRSYPSLTTDHLHAVLAYRNNG